MIMHAAAAEVVRAGSGDALSDRVRQGLERAAEILRAHDLPVPSLAGKLLRPTLAYALVPADRRHELDDRFWLGALAIQMVHEASLLHDDVLDEADERRGAPTVFSSHGVGRALVLGDHYLTAAYRAALWTRSEPFLECFITAVERTVAGEVLQGRTTGQRLDLDTYFDAILGKSGELMRASASLGPHVLGLDRVDERSRLGLQLGALYQQVDDLLDYCPAAETGKEGLKDYRQRKWTWVLDLAGVESWDLSDRHVLDSIFGGGEAGVLPAHRALVYLEVRRKAILRTLEDLVPGDPTVAEILDAWIEAARDGIDAQVAAHRPLPGPGSRPPGTGQSDEAFVAETARRMGGPARWPGQFRRHARTFSLAARLFPEPERRSVEALYAYCRFTDDLVDESDVDVDVDTLGRRLEVWRQLTRAAFDGTATDIPLLDTVMGDAARAGVDWLYPRALLDGVAMDLHPRLYTDWKDLERYTFGVAGSVGGWMTLLFGIRDPDTLGRAHALGHAMQLTNILRDVGEDLDMGRIYLPTCLLDRHGITVADLRAWKQGSDPVPRRYVDAMDDLVRAADERYARALPGIARLPRWFGRPVAVAAAAYRGIHDEVRRNDFDNLRLRAHTSLGRKLWLGARGLARARRSKVAFSAAREGLAT